MARSYTAQGPGSTGLERASVAKRFRRMILFIVFLFVLSTIQTLWLIQHVLSPWTDR